jgi:ribonuclease P protein subunit RPR2
MRNKGLVHDIALQRISLLFGFAEASAQNNPYLSLKYAKLLSKIKVHYRIALPNTIKNRICGSCGRVLVPGSNCKVRLSSSDRFVIYFCICGKNKRVKY